MENVKSEKPKTNKIIKIGCLTIFCVFILVMIIVAISGKKETDPKKDRNVNSTEEMAFLIAIEFVKPQLKSPSTAVFPSYPDKRRNDKIGEWTFFSYVDSQNSFGAMIRTNFDITIIFQGGDDSDTRNWKVKSFDFL